MIELARSTYYYTPALSREIRELDDLLLKDLIDIIHQDFPGYGYRRIGAHLRREGIVVNDKRIRRIMQQYKLFPITWKKFSCKTTDSNHSNKIYPNLIKDLEVTRLNQVWVADLTYIRIKSCFVYLAVILDLLSRKVIGWALSRSLDRQVCIEALKMAIEARKPAAGCIHHSDRGVQYSSDDYINLLVENGIEPSMSAKGYAYDNGAPRMC
jgi:putative transposase